MISGKKYHEVKDFCVSDYDLWVIFPIIKKNTLVITLCTHVHTHMPIHITCKLPLFFTHTHTFTFINHVCIFIVTYPSMVFTYCHIHAQVKVFCVNFDLGYGRCTYSTAFLLTLRDKPSEISAWI